MRSIFYAALIAIALPTAALAGDGISTHSDGDEIHSDIYAFARSAQGNPQIDQSPAPSARQPIAGRDFYATSPEVRAARNRRSRY